MGDTEQALQARKRAPTLLCAWILATWAIAALHAGCGSGGSGEGTSGGEGSGQLYDRLVACRAMTPGYFDGQVPVQDELADCYAACLVELECDELRLAICNSTNEPGQACVRACDPPFTCVDGTEIYERERCDGVWQCQDQSDEQGCESVMPAPGVFLCSEEPGRWIPDTGVCDGIGQCPGDTDEEDCTYFTCGDGEVAHVDARCNDWPECFDGSDERDCPPPEPFACDNGFEITVDDVCDGNAECQYGEDELDCPGQEGFRCNDGRMIPLMLRCDNDENCDDGSDEEGCGRLSCSG